MSPNEAEGSSGSRSSIARDQASALAPWVGLATGVISLIETASAHQRFLKTFVLTLGNVLAASIVIGLFLWLAAVIVGAFLRLHDEAYRPIAIGVAVAAVALGWWATSHQTDVGVAILGYAAAGVALYLIWDERRKSSAADADPS